MLLTPEFVDHGPDITIFTTKEKAKAYIRYWCERKIKSLTKQMINAQQEIEFNKNCINKLD